jgi:hypothetical protein
MRYSVMGVIAWHLMYASYTDICHSQLPFSTYFLLGFFSPSPSTRPPTLCPSFLFPLPASSSDASRLIRGLGGALPQNSADPAGQVCLRTNPTGGNDDERVQQASRHDLARALAPRYARASRREKSQLLDEFCVITAGPTRYMLTACQ